MSETDTDAGTMTGWITGPGTPRIVACVNACAGIPTPALEAGALGEALNLLERLYTERRTVKMGDEIWVNLRKLGRLP
jgi:hypothetical protein